VPRRLLIVEDNESLRDMLRDLLSDRGFDVLVAADGNAGLTALRDVTIDGVLADFELPGMSGIEFCRAVRQNPTRRGAIPVWLMTGAHEADLEHQAAAAGARGVLTKPFSVVEIGNELARTFSASAVALGDAPEPGAVAR
jgi:two-component system chemotaxis response regulator CheY